MGKKSTTTKETSNQVSNQTSTPVIGNASLSSGLQGYLDSLNEFSNTDPSSLVTGPSALQQQAFNGAAGLTTSPLLGQAGALAGQVGGAGSNLATGQGYDPAMTNAATVGDLNTSQGSSLMDSLNGYLGTGSGYTQNVTNAFTDDFDQTAGQTRAAQAAQGAANGAFGGSRYGVQEAQTEGELARARSSGLAGILQGGYDRALSAAGQDASLAQNNSQFNANTLNQSVLTNAANQQQANLANQDAANTAGQYNSGLLANMSQFNANQQDSALARQLSAAGLLGNLGQAQGSEARANIGTQGIMGQQQRDIAQSQATSGLSMLQALQSLYGYNPALFTGQKTSGTSQTTGTSKTTENPGLLASIGQGAQGIGALASLFTPATATQAAGPMAAIFSDARLKENIRHIGKRPDGLNLYAYNYLWSDEEVTGVMAHEVLQVMPEAVGNIGGFMTVDYGVLDVQ